MTFKGMDGWDRAVYEDPDGNLWKDIYPKKGVPPQLYSATNNEFDGEPDQPFEGECEFSPGRAVWLEGRRRNR